MGSLAPPLLDAVVIGAGFSGLYVLKQLRDKGFSVEAFELLRKGGGVWYSNGYPGCRVDSEVPMYQFSEEDTWKSWNWKQTYPGRDELVAYFDQTIKAWGLADLIHFSTPVTSAYWKPDTSLWEVHVTGPDGKQETYNCRFLIPCTGFASKSYTPPFRGIESFEGAIYHSSHWPEEGVDLSNKKVAIIGTGASGVQILQEAGKVATTVTVYQRTPNLAAPMHNPNLDQDANDKLKETLAETLKARDQTLTGLGYSTMTQKAADLSTEERTDVWEDLYSRGGGRFVFGNFNDMLTDSAINDSLYDFWRQKTLKRIKNPRKAELLAPRVPPHPLGTKRVSLEVDFYEICDQDNVEIVSVKETPISEFVKNGAKTTDGQLREADILIMATGFDSITGGLTQLDIRGRSGQTLGEKWVSGVSSFLGMTVNDFPNLFYLYGPQAPTAFAAGPVSAELQGAWVVHTIHYLLENGFKEIEATKEAENEWKEHVADVGSVGLFSVAESWYFGANIPGKKREPLNYMAGLPTYKQKLWDSVGEGYAGFSIS